MSLPRWSWRHQSGRRRRFHFGHPDRRVINRRHFRNGMNPDQCRAITKTEVALGLVILGAVLLDSIARTSSPTLVRAGF